jgi:hydroxyacylglutathione hydrolase
MPTVRNVLETGATLIQQMVHEELGNSTHLVVDRATGWAAVIDPARDADLFLDLAAAAGWQVESVLETHVHNDFMSGGPDIRAAVGASWVVPVTSGIRGADRELSDGDELQVGSMVLRAVHSPGHTPEHLSYLLVGPDGKRLALLSGGALMVGTMARPDLLGPSHTFGLSRSGFTTMRHFMTNFDDALLVLPTHGGGSFCGAAPSGERITTIGIERRSNALVAAPDVAHFLAIHTRQGEYPAYYRHMAPRNRLGEPTLKGTAPVLSRVTPDQLEESVAAGAVVVDCRPHAAFDFAHVPDSIAVPLHGPFSPWVGWVVDIDTTVILVADSADDATEAMRQLIRIGFTHVGGWLEFAQWVAGGRSAVCVTRLGMADLAESILDGGDITVVDVRQEREWASGHLPGAMHALPDAMPALATTLDRAAPVAVYCASGHRSAVAASLLKRAGVADVWHIGDGFDAWQASGHPLVASSD